VGERRPFLLRIDPEVLAALERWARDDLRSLNGQIEFLRDTGRVKDGPGGPPSPAPREKSRR
jgi:hypothetical protein